MDGAPALLGRGPVLAGDLERCGEPCRLALDDGERLARLAGDDRRHAALEDAGLLGGDLFDRVAEKLVVIEREPRDHARQRTLDHIGSVEAAAEPNFEEREIRRMAREHDKCRGSLDLEY